MANIDEMNGDEKLQQDKKQRKHDSGAADLEKVTDWTEENESLSIANAAQMFVDKGIKEAEEKLAKEVELQKISIKKVDIELIMQELEVSKEKAEKALRENKGDVVEACIYLMQ